MKSLFPIARKKKLSFSMNFPLLIIFGSMSPAMILMLRMESLIKT